MAQEKLNSERVNYLVWRYLQEAGFGQSAARLQRDWGITDPEKLSFAPHIEPHSLVRLLQNGLHHLGIKASLSANSKESVPFFGPETAATNIEQLTQVQNPSTPYQRGGGSTLTNGSSADGALQTSAPKRSRRSNGALNGKAKSSDSMDVDDNASRNDMEMEIDGHETVGDVAVADVMAMAMANNVANAASGEADYGDTNGVGSGPSHFQDQEQQQQQQQQQQQHLMPTLTNGVSVGVQSDKVTNLGPETAVLNIVGKNLTQATWNPKHPTLLAAGGKALCQIWALDQQSYANSQSGIAAATEASGTATPTATTNGATTSHNNLAVSPSDTTELEIDGAASVTAMAWSPSGDHIAYSSFPSSNTLVQRSITTVWSKEGFVEEQLPSGTEPVVGLAWSPTGRYLAAISGKSLVVLDKKMSEVLPACETKGSLLDVVWLDQGPQLAVCGESIIAITGIAENRITDPLELSQSEVNHDWTQMQYDTHTSTIAVASEESGYLALVEGAGPLRSTKAHEAALTGLMYRPMAGSDAISSTARRLLATSSVDGTVKLWNGRAGLQHVHTFNLGAPALSLCFTPDGRHVAAASCSKILFWSAQEGCLPKAIWESPHIHQHARHLEGTNYTNGTNGVENGDVDMEDDLSVPSLTWDSNGHKLALACKDKVTVINYYQ